MEFRVCLVVARAEEWRHGPDDVWVLWLPVHEHIMADLQSFADLNPARPPVNPEVPHLVGTEDVWRVDHIFHLTITVSYLLLNDRGRWVLLPPQDDHVGLGVISVANSLNIAQSELGLLFTTCPERERLATVLREPDLTVGVIAFVIDEQVPSWNI